jgi:nucleoside 2-deoxyribosyltransferase
MRLTICSSATFAQESREIRKKLEEKGVDALLYPQTVRVKKKTMNVREFYAMRKKNLTEELLTTKKQLMDEHIDKIKNSDAVLILNFDKPKNPGYVGGNSFLELGVAYALGKKVFIWKKPTDTLPYYEEIMAMRPIIIEEDLEKIK